MRFISFNRPATDQAASAEAEAANAEPAFGAVVEDRVVDLSIRLPAHPTLLATLRAGALIRAGDIAAETTADYGLGEVTLLAPLPNLPRVFCLSAAKGGEDALPAIELRSPGAFVGPDEPLLLPEETRQLGCEGRLALIIGRSGRRIEEKQAWRHVAGFTLISAGWAEDWGARGSFWGGNIDATSAVGPWLVTTDEVEDRSTLEVTTLINGEQRRCQPMADPITRVPWLLSSLSTILTLQPGDVIVLESAAPEAAGSPAYLSSGDSACVEAAGIGSLSNPVVAEAADEPTPSSDDHGPRDTDG